MYFILRTFHLKLVAGELLNVYKTGALHSTIYQR
jgi:hypothetical protein